MTGEVDMKVPAGSRSGDKLVMRSKGIVKQNGLFGHQYVHLDVEIPKNMTPKQKELIEEFAKLESEPTGANNNCKPSSWFQRFKDLLSKRDSSSKNL